LPIGAVAHVRDVQVVRAAYNVARVIQLYDDSVEMAY
jgi:hypothetical protein